MFNGNHWPPKPIPVPMPEVGPALLWVVEGREAMVRAAESMNQMQLELHLATAERCVAEAKRMLAELGSAEPPQRQAGRPRPIIPQPER